MTWSFSELCGKIASLQVFRRGSAPFCETVGVRMRCLTTGMAWPGWLGPCHVEAPHCQHKCLSPVGSGSAGRHLSPRPPLPSLPAAMETIGLAGSREDLAREPAADHWGSLPFSGYSREGVCLVKTIKFVYQGIHWSTSRRLSSYRCPGLREHRDSFQRI